MTQLRGRSLRGKRLFASAACGRWRATTMIGSVRQDGSTACMTIEGVINAEARTNDTLLHAIGHALEQVTKKDAAHWFAHCDYNFI